MIRKMAMIVAMGAAFTLAVLAEDQPASNPAASGPAKPVFVWWEGESFKNTDFPKNDALSKGGWFKGDLLSGGKWFGATSLPAGAFIEYEVDVPKEGTYKFYVRKFWKHGPFKWKFGDGQWTECGKDCKLVDGMGEELAPNICVNWVSLGDVKMTAGKVIFRLEQIDTGNACYDCFVLTEGPFTPNSSLKPDGSGKASTQAVALSAPASAPVATPEKAAKPADKPADAKPVLSAISKEFADFKTDKTLANDRKELGDLVKFIDFDKMIDQQAEILKLDDARKEKAKLTDDQKEKLLKKFREKIDGLKDGSNYDKVKKNIESAVKDSAPRAEQLKKLRAEYDNKFFADAFKLLTGDQPSIYYTSRICDIMVPEFNILLLSPEQDNKLRAICGTVAKKLASKPIDLSADQAGLLAVKMDIARQILTPAQMAEWQKGLVPKK